MRTMKKTLQIVAAMFAATTTAFGAVLSAGLSLAAAAVESPVEYVNPFIGTSRANNGHTFPVLFRQPV